MMRATPRGPLRCGLNADWSCDAWHFGPSPLPNTASGDVYVLEEAEAYEVVMRDEGDEIHVLAVCPGILEAFRIASFVTEFLAE